MKYTDQQEAIFSAIENEEGHVFVNAGAGCGKTSTIVESANRINAGSSAFLAFNKSIATELQKKLPDNVEAKTFHAFGFAAIRKAGIRTKVNNYKVRNIIADLFGKDYHATPVAKLVSLIKGSMTDARDTRRINQLIDEFDIQFQSSREERLAISNIPAILEQCRTQTNVIDFDDMIWLPLVNNYPLPHYDMLFVDEAQDFNEMQRELIVRVVNGGRCIVVGDPNQAIYGFRGADSNSMRMFKERLEKESDREIIELPLSISWRCPISVVQEANRYVSEFHHAPNAQEGKVVANASFTPQSGDMVLCRYNAPLVSAFYNLITQGQSAYILGRDMTKGLIAEVHKITKNDAMGIEEFMELFTISISTQVDKLHSVDKVNQAMALEDKADCIRIFASRSETVADIISNIKEVFDGNNEGEIMLSTVHKAKGLEAKNVFILATERMPHPKGGHEENNICYVAITRAQENLYFCGPRPAIN